jgi:2-polyprenyl-3-methyl-5-hydroxy-6-metoxy-1,4-benzoquinol methylase
MAAPTPSINQQKSEAFAQKMMGVLNSSALALMTSIGHRTGLFDTMAGMPPATSQQIADRAALNERYVREWLGAMVTGGLVDYAPEGKLYQLPAEHAAWLTRTASPNCLAAFTQYVGLLGSVEDRIIECFHKGGGVPYEEFHRFHAVMAEDSGQSVVAALFDHILPLVPGLDERLKRGIDVLDIGCGSGLAMNLLARAYPHSRFTGYDFSAEAIARAQAEAAQSGAKNLRFAVADVSRLEEKQQYDLITAFDAIHDQARPDEVLKRIAQALRDDGVLLMQDISGSSELHNNISHPAAPFLYTISCMHCMTVSLALGGAGLGTMWGKEKATEMLKAAGFRSVEIKDLPHDIQNTYFIVRKK